MKKSPEPGKVLFETRSDTQSLWNAFWEGLQEGILLIDREYRIQDLNPSALKLLGLPKEEILGRTCHEVLFGSLERCEKDTDFCPGSTALDSSKPSGKREFIRQDPEGRSRHFQIRSYPILEDSGQPKYALEFIMDVTAEKTLLHFQGEAALRDPLTGLYNRKAFHIYLNRELKRTQRQGHKLSLCLVNLDSFKDFNDKHGEEEGDKLLDNLGRLLLNSTREEVDVVCRLESDTFSVILPEAGRDTASQIAERIRIAQKETRFPAPFSLAKCEAGENEDAESFYHRVVEALFTAKKKGGDRNL